MLKRQKTNSIVSFGTSNKEMKSETEYFSRIDCNNDTINSNYNLNPFLCNNCVNTYEKERMLTESENYDEEELDVLGFDLNPDMQEESNCHFCLKRKKTVDAVCLFDGLPSCLNCSKKRNESTSDINYNTLNQILNETSLINNTIVEKKKGMKRFNTQGNINYVSERPAKLQSNNSIVNAKMIESCYVETMESGLKSTRKKKSFFHGSSKNVNEMYERDTNEEVVEYVGERGKGPSIFEYSHREIDNKIMNMVSTKISNDSKFKKKNLNLVQLDKTCKSLDHIFENMGTKVSINLPIIFEGDAEDAKEAEIKKLCEENGNYLFVFFDSQKELLFGIVFNNFSGKKIGKLFKKISSRDDTSPKGLKSSQIEYADQILENIYFKNNLMIVDNCLIFDTTTLKFTLEGMRFNKFLTIARNRVLLNSLVNSLNIYDMC